MHIVPQAVKTAIALAVGAGALVAASAVQAAVVFTPVNISIPATTAGIYVNVLTGAFGTAATTAGWDINPWGSAGLGFFGPAGAASPAYVMTPGSTVQVANLAPGSVIDGSVSFGSGSSTAANAAQWNLNSSNNFFGFRFLNEGNGAVHYGFAQLQIGAAITDRSIIGIGYESVAQIPITVVPEPGTYALMGLGLTGLALVARRRKQQA